MQTEQGHPVPEEVGEARGHQRSPADEDRLQVVRGTGVWLFQRQNRGLHHKAVRTLYEQEEGVVLLSEGGQDKADRTAQGEEGGFVEVKEENKEAHV